MPNYSKQTLVRVGRLLNPAATGHMKKLAEAAGFGPKAIYNWTVADTDPQHRQMPPSAKRVVALLAYFGAAGLLTEQRLRDIIALEAALEEEQEALALLRRIRNTATKLRSKSSPAAESIAPQEAESAAH